MKLHIETKDGAYLFSGELHVEELGLTLKDIDDRDPERLAELRDIVIEDQGHEQPVDSGPPEGKAARKEYWRQRLAKGGMLQQDPDRQAEAFLTGYLHERLLTSLEDKFEPNRAAMCPKHRHNRDLASVGKNRTKGTVKFRLTYEEAPE